SAGRVLRQMLHLLQKTATRTQHELFSSVNHPFTASDEGKYRFTFTDNNFCFCTTTEKFINFGKKFLCKKTGRVASNNRDSVSGISYGDLFVSQRFKTASVSKFSAA